MLISREKRRTNIAEYILYMWQVEDTIRAFGFDIDRLDRELISRYDQPAEVRGQIREWYSNLAGSMKREKVERSGHLGFLKKETAGLYAFHLSLLQQPDEQEYSILYFSVLPLIREMNAKQKWTGGNEIETCLNAIYVYMMMRLQKRDISKETEEAISQFIELTRMLSSKFHAMEKSRDNPGR